MLAMPDNVSVRFRDCACPGTPHPDGDYAELRPYLDFAGGAEALVAISSITTWSDDGEAVLNPALYLTTMMPMWLRLGVTSWNLVDEEGPIEVTTDTIDALRWEDAYELADKADDIYQNQVLVPLVRRAAKSTKDGPTAGSTSPRRRSSATPPTP